MSDPVLDEAVLLDHYRHPHGRGIPGNATTIVTVENKGCADKITIALCAAGNDLFTVHFDGKGCVISQAAASILVSLCSQKSRKEILQVGKKLEQLVTGKVAVEAYLELGDGLALAGIREYPTRVRCALLAWEALKGALTKS